MATFCFCGCGRKVRFASKRLSSYGSEIRVRLRQLGYVAEVVRRSGSEDELATILRFVDEGKRLQQMLVEVIHGTGMAPTMREQAVFHEWLKTAGNIGASLPPMPPEQSA